MKTSYYLRKALNISHNIGSNLIEELNIYVNKDENNTITEKSHQKSSKADHKNPNSKESKKTQSDTQDKK